MPSSIMAMPMAMSFTPLNLHAQPWNSPNSMPAKAAASTPTHGDPDSYATA